MTTWTTRAERPEDRDGIRRVHEAAFPTPAEAGLVEALREDPDAWVPGLSVVGLDGEGRVVGHALVTRGRVGVEPALVLAPVGVLPEVQRSGVGSAVVGAVLDRVRREARAENVVLVLGDPAYYPRFGFEPASRWDIRSPYDVPDEANMALALDDGRPVPAGEIAYPAAFASLG